LFPSPPFPSRRDSAVVLVGNWMMDLVHIEIRLHSCFFEPLYFLSLFFPFFKMMLSKSSYDVHLKMAPGKDDIWSLSPSQGEKKLRKNNIEMRISNAKPHDQFLPFFLLEFFLYFFRCCCWCCWEWVGLIPSWEDVNPVRDGNAPSGRQRQKATWKQVELEWKR
jgi:hypothetical protein